jgi:cell division protein FtsB
MRKSKTSVSDSEYKPLRPALSPESRSNQLVSLAYDLAEKQLRDGTASSQVITEFLKLGSEKANLEREKLKGENELLKAKVEKLQSEQRSEELFKRAIKAFSRYQGHSSEEDDEYDY